MTDRTLIGGLSATLLLAALTVACAGSPAGTVDEGDGDGRAGAPKSKPGAVTRTPTPKPSGTTAAAGATPVKGASPSPGVAASASPGGTPSSAPDASAKPTETPLPGFTPDPTPTPAPTLPPLSQRSPVEQAVAGASKNDVLMPLKEGMLLKYEGSYGIGAEVLGLKATVAPKAASAGATPVQVEADLGGVKQDLSYAFTSDDGWLRFDSVKGRDGKGLPILPASMTLGKTWSLTGPDWTGKVVAEVSEAVTVKAGSYRGVFRVHYTDQTAAQTDLMLWFAPTIGLIKVEVLDMMMIGWPRPLAQLPFKGTVELAEGPQQQP